MRRFWIILLVLLFSHSICAVKIELFPTGQGNTVLLTHRGEAMLVDAGSSDSRFTAFYHEKAIKKKSDYALQPFQEKVSRRKIPGSTERLGAPKDDSTETSSMGSHEASGFKGRTAIQPSQKRRKLASGGAVSLQEDEEDYMDVILGGIRGALPSETITDPELKKGKRSRHTSSVLRVKTVVVTHPDIDHYNLLPDIFNGQQEFSIGTLILSGFWFDYNQKFRNWVEHNRKRNRERIHDVFCTGMENGIYQQDDGKPITIKEGDVEAKYARAYYSGLQGQTPFERALEETLQFTQVPGSDSPLITILSINAGHAAEPDGSVRIANRSKNVSSLVLRIQEGQKSCILSGDAENETWDHVLRATRAQGRTSLQTDYFLISHHGSKENGATRPDILELLQPKACFLSVGKRKQYGHPNQEALKHLWEFPSLYATNIHPVSYFWTCPHQAREKETLYRRRQCKKAIFSTLNHGVLSFDLAIPFNVHTTLVKDEACATIPLASGKQFALLLDYDQVYRPEEEIGFDEALSEMGAHWDAQGIPAFFWREGEKGILEPAFEESAEKDPLFLEKMQHILLDEEKERFYLLREEEDIGESR